MQETIIHALALIGAIVVVCIVGYVLVLLFGVLLIGLEYGLDRISTLAFRLGGGDEDTHPSAPLDRVWAETLWLKKWVRWLIRELGFSKWNNVSKPNRPDIERLHELRGKSKGE